MTFRTTAFLICTKCAFKKAFMIKADIVTDKLKDAKEVKNWNSIGLYPIEFRGCCSNCRNS